MAQTVATTLQLFDNFSKQLNIVNQSVDKTALLMSKLQKSANGDINLKVDADKATRQLDTMSNKVNSLGRTMNTNTTNISNSFNRVNHSQQQVITSQQKMNKAIKNGSHEAEGLAKQVKGLVAAYLTFESFKNVFSESMRGAMEQSSLLDMFVARSRAEGLGQAIYNEISKGALAAGQDVTQALNGARAFLASTSDPAQLRELNKLSMRLAKLNPGEGLEGAAFSMKELLSGDYMSISERFDISKIILQKSDALKAGKAGDLEGFIKGMDKLLDQQNMTSEAFEKMLDSPAAKWQRVLNTFKFNMASTGLEALETFEPLFDTINNGFESGKFNQFFASIQTGMTLIANVTTVVVQFLIDHWNIVANTLLVVGIVAAAVAAQFIIGWLAAAWPIALIAAGIIGLLSLLNTFGISTGEVIGYVIGSFYSMFASINNNVALIWNLILSFAEFLVNIFIDPVYAIKKLFYDMFNAVADYFTTLINDIIDGLNWVVNAINSVVGTSINVMGHVSGDGGPSKPTTDANVIDLSKYKMEQLSKTEAFSKGLTVGEKFTKGLSNFTAGAGAGSAQAYKVPTAGSALKTPNVGKVGKVGQVDKIKDTVDISSEDLKVMRDLAEMNTIQNFVTLTPTVQVKTGNIMQAVDVDQMIEQIADAMEKEIASSAKGVYG